MVEASILPIGIGQGGIEPYSKNVVPSPNSHRYLFLARLGPAVEERRETSLWLQILLLYGGLHEERRMREKS